MINSILKIFFLAMLGKFATLVLNPMGDPSIVMGKTNHRDGININLSYDGKMKNEFKLQLNGKTGIVDTPLIILQPTEDVSPGELYKRYLDEMDDPTNISVTNILTNLMDTFEPIEQKKFLDNLLGEIETHIEFYESLSLK
ncbi:hypothetical protein PGO_080500 [Plasmodium gonderi]|uniref:Uncharacterized protein n=1 Tax=Plasmodium gonderi TaxID=77519 RepID=A0A1Y1JDC3_PLAGO|nr:hypothetical protein PGO_080500 [Plasmodium gonderi]GAW80486.1 hypothetical protein PGO_080500 [Plasmodium gonderi]